MIPHSRPSLGPEEEAAACRVIRSGRLAQGQEVAELESELSDVLGVAHVVAVSSGSAALHLALLAHGIGHGDAVAMPTYVCTALLNAARHVGARPILSDVHPETCNIAPEDLSRRLTPNTRAIIVPHMFGCAADLPALEDLGIPVIEDCAMALGADQDGRKLGSIGRISTFSFYATKVLCAGEGGAAATPDPDLADRLRDLRDYDGRRDGRPRFNYKLTDLQAAVARTQLRKLETFVARRRQLGIRYARELASVGVGLPCFAPGDYPFRYVVRHGKGAAGLIPRFEQAGVAARQPVFCPLHRCLGLDDDAYPNATRVFLEAVSLPLYPSLSDDEVHTILHTAREVL